MLTADNDYSKSALTKLQGNTRKKRSIVYDKVTAPFEAIEWVSDAIESGPRFAYYKTLRAKGINPSEAFYESRDITTNFKRSGTISRRINKVIPFFNASVQGLDKFARYLSAQDAPPSKRKATCRNRVAFWVAVGASTALLVSVLNKLDEEEYKQLSTYQKNNLWNIPLGNGEFFAIPKPRELAILSSTFERGFELAAMDNKDAFYKYNEYLASVSLPPVISDAVSGVSNLALGDKDSAMNDFRGAFGSTGILGTGFYMLTNKDFLGRDIVPPYLEQKESKFQFDQRTSMLAKAIGEAFNTSPMQIDFFLNNTFGGYQKINKALMPVGGEQYRDYTLGVKNTYLKDNRYTTDVVNQFYDAKTAADKKKNSYPDTKFAIQSKEYSTMASFYSNYSSLAKTESKSPLSQATRQTVLDMLEQFTDDQQSGARSGVKYALDRLAKSLDDTTFFPSVMPEELKLGIGYNSKSYKLNSSQYVDYQTLYLNYYYDRVEAAFDRTQNNTDEFKLKQVEKAKRLALEDVKKATAKKLGVQYFG